jgi:hypothetical protein
LSKIKVHRHIDFIIPLKKKKKTNKQHYLFFRIARWIDEEEDRIKSSGENSLQYVILDMSGK